MLKVSNSRVKLWRRCRFAHHCKYNMKIVRKRKGVNFSVGGMVHGCLDKLTKGKNWKLVISKQQKVYNKLFEEEQALYAEVLPLCKGMMDGYEKFYKEDSMELEYIETEIRLQFPITDDIMFDGYVDNLVKDMRNRIFIMEHKTCKTIPEESVRSSDIQTVLYNWALPQATKYKKVSGVIWDYLRKKVPSVPEELKKGGLSKNSRIDTTHEIYLKAIKDNGLKVSDYKDMLVMLKEKNTKFFRRITLPFQSNMIDTVVEDFKRSAIEIKYIGEKDKQRNLRYDCNNMCDYYSYCMADLSGLDTEHVLNREYKEKEDGKKEENYF